MELLIFYNHIAYNWPVKIRTTAFGLHSLCSAIKILFKGQKMKKHKVEDMKKMGKGNR